MRMPRNYFCSAFGESPKKPDAARTPASRSLYAGLGTGLGEDSAVVIIFASCGVCDAGPMKNSLRKRLVPVFTLTVTAVAVVGMLAGCSSLTSPPAAAGSRDSASTTSATPVPANTDTPTHSQTSQATPSTPRAAVTSPRSANAPQSSSAASRSAASRLCAGTALSGAVAFGNGGAAGSTEPDLILTNRGSATCTLQGWPGVSFVGHGNGTQLGAAAQQVRSSAHPTVTIRPGGSALVPLKVAQAVNFPKQSCNPVTADGFRVYPPGSRTALFIKATGFTACANPQAGVLTVSAVLPRS